VRGLADHLVTYSSFANICKFISDKSGVGGLQLVDSAHTCKKLIHLFMNISIPSIAEPETTGRYLVLFRQDAVDSGIQTLVDAGLNHVARTADFPDNAVTEEQLKNADTCVFDNLGVAVATLDPEQLQSLNVANDNASPILAIEPERVVYALSDVGFGKLGQPMSSSSANLSVEYLRGYRDAVVNLVDNLTSTVKQSEVTETTSNEGEATWGLQATKVINSRLSGRGIKVAVLDTGFDLTHPDFVGRKIISKSFVENEEVQDGHGHGTHCIGTACGPLSPSILPRYGVAYEAEIYAGKVLSNEGSGSDFGILAGIEWAIANGCRIVSMSLGGATVPGQRFSRTFENVARRTLQNGTLIIAAAGNESQRQFGIINPVAHPANCPSIMAVAALDSQLKVAGFSNRGINPSGGQIDIAGPGVAVYSSWSSSSLQRPMKYNTINGTSMATPHVAGIAALYAEANPNASAQALWNLLTQKALRLPLPSEDVGVGLVQAPS
jgi:subtilisin family serine protease